MGKLICDSTASSPVVPWRDPTATPSNLDSIDLVDQMSATAAAAAAATPWENVSGLEEQQRRSLVKLQAKGVLWKHPKDQNSSVVFRLSHGGEVESDGNCLFTASIKAMGLATAAATARDLRRRTVLRFMEDFGSARDEEREMIESAIKHMYSPDLNAGWGIHVVQELKLLAKKEDRDALDSAITELVQLGMQRELAAESIYKERCIAVDDGPSWAKYMLISGSPDDEYNIINLQYTEDGLLTIDENRDGRAAAFGDDIAIECLATEFKREIFVVQAHGSDAMVDEDNCVFFLPHSPRSEICESPFFLFMKGTGWCGAGADHYEPLIAHPSPFSQEKVALVL
nr:Pleckstriny-like domain family A member [Ipomoea batatas]